MKIINDKSDRIVKVECAETPNNIRSNIGIDLKFIDLSDSYAYNNKDKTCYFSAVQI